jgi:hypothetical protein
MLFQGDAWGCSSLKAAHLPAQEEEHRQPVGHSSLSGELRVPENALPRG